MPPFGAVRTKRSQPGMTGVVFNGSLSSDLSATLDECARGAERSRPDVELKLVTTDAATHGRPAGGTYLVRHEGQRTADLAGRRDRGRKAVGAATRIQHRPCQSAASELQAGCEHGGH